MKYRLLLMFNLSLLLFTTKAQQDPLFSLYNYNHLWHNPAYAGFEEKNIFGLSYRDQWVKFDHNDQFVGSNPVTALFTYDMPLDNVIHGIGAVLMYDEIGFSKTVQIGLSFNHKVEFSNKVSLRFGPQISLVGAYRDFTNMNPADTNDPIIPSGKQQDFKPDIDFGLWFNYSEFYAGISYKHIIEPNFDFGSWNYSLIPHLYATSGYNFELSEKFQLQPSILSRLVIRDLKALLMDVNCRYIYRKSFILGLTYRLQLNERIIDQSKYNEIVNSAVILAGVELLEKIQILTSIDIHADEEIYKLSGPTYEAVLRFRF